MSYTILLVEDNPYIMEINHEALLMEGYNVLMAADGKQCLEILARADADLIVLDVMLPDVDGLTLCREIKAKYDIPILFLSALGENADIINALKVGGDDYMTKPYDLGVLLARVAARLRSVQSGKRFISIGELKLDTVSLIAYFADADLLLSQKEFQILMILAKNAGRPVPKEELYKNIWGSEPGPDINALYTTVSRLNKKLAGAGSMLAATAEHGKGYILEDV